MIEDVLSSIIADYEYSQSNIFDKDLDIVYDAKRSLLEIKGVYRHGSVVKQGTCSELMETALIEITEHLPRLSTFRAVGNDDAFFYDDGSVHSFLLVHDKPILEKIICTTERTDLDLIRKANPLVVDPSFGKVIPLEDSGYSVKTLYGPTPNINYNNSPILGSKSGLPLYVNDANVLVILQTNFKLPEKLDIGLQSPYNPPVYFPIQFCLDQNLFHDRPDAGDFFKRLLATSIVEGELETEDANLIFDPECLINKVEIGSKRLSWLT